METADSEIRKVLSFVKDNVITASEWRRNGKAAYGKPDDWNEFRMSGKGCMLTFSKETQKAIREFVDIGPYDGSTLYILNDKGLALLSEKAGA